MKTYSIFALFLLLLMNSCLSDPEPNDISSIEEEINLNLSQIPSEEGMQLSFELTSVDAFDCEDAHIQSNLDQHLDALSLDLISIIIPEDCSAGELPARGKSSKFLDIGTYNFDVTIGDLRSENGILEVTNEHFEIKLEPIPGLNIQNSLIHRIPENHVWGELHLESLSSEDWQDFLDGMQIYTKHSPKVSRGNYGLFEIFTTANFFTENAPVSFLFLEANDLEGLKQFITLFRAQHPGLEINLMHSTGVII